MEPRDHTPPGHLVRRRSLHIVTSHRCQNNCVFCSDGGDRVRIERPNPAVVRSLLEQNRHHDVVCFSTHEPTLHPDLVSFVSWARELEFGTVSLITNGRTLARGGLMRQLAEAGLNDLHVSIHGHEAEIHDRITRRPGSFAQAVAGLDAALEIRGVHPVRVTAHSTISAFNLASLPQMIDFFGARGVDHYGINGLFIEGLAVENFELLAVSYKSIAEVLSAALAGPCPSVSVSDIPPCQLNGRIPDHAMGLREDFHVVTEGEPDAPAREEATSVERSFGFGPPCMGCVLRAICDGVADAYIARFGWGEFHPVTASDLRDAPAFTTEERLGSLLTSPTGEWVLSELTLEPTRAQARLRSPGLSRELLLLIEPLEPETPAYRRTRRYNLSLKGGDHGPDEIALAERVFAQVEAGEER
ncbi:MAG: radical SAM protein [Pseudomonadota bacterium]